MSKQEEFLKRFFRGFGQRVKTLRVESGLTQEDMISKGYSARHWQQIEAGRPITLKTALRICHTFKVPVEELLKGLDEGAYAAKGK